MSQRTESLLYQDNPATTNTCDYTPSLTECIQYLNLSEPLIGSLPFSVGDATAGSETELQVAVIGNRDAVDLPITIENSNYFANVAQRTETGDTSKKALTKLENYLDDNDTNVWENSWVRLPKHRLNVFACNILDKDLKANKKNHASGYRSDIHTFIFTKKKEEYLRIPISYLVKLALADALYYWGKADECIKKTGIQLLAHFSNDNTSPETFSFHISPVEKESGNGKALAKETAMRYLFTQLLVMYANKKFSLMKNGQKAIIFFSPHPPIRQKYLNDCISDNFYRELFMSPCLSGWDKGEEKYEYMKLCHQVLSRSHLNAVTKLREAGIILNNLIILPNTSNISLANNGVHITLGSKKVTRLLSDPQAGFSHNHEKYLGDLVIKISEHFLPLFVGKYSAAPYLIDFVDFHPERALGFLAHELDYTHLRMIWRRWKKKARNKFMGHPLTPLGPSVLDELLRFGLQLKGDFIDDFRLIDYLVALMSTEKSNALDGTLHNTDSLLRDLDKLGVFDERMSLYLLLKLRSHQTMGFSGFEGRYYSLFENFSYDMKFATDLQTLLCALAYKYITREHITHNHIPSEPFIESERRQIFFGSAINLPTFYVRKNSKNLFLKKILQKTQKIRQSHRYPGYVRVYTKQYQKALYDIIKEDAADIIEILSLQPLMEDLNLRIHHPEVYSASAKLTKGILHKAGYRSPYQCRGNEFNQYAEHYYRDDLRIQHIQEALQFLVEDISSEKIKNLLNSPSARKTCHTLLGGQNPVTYINKIKQDIINETIPTEKIVTLLYIMILVESQESCS